MFWKVSHRISPCLWLGRRHLVLLAVGFALLPAVGYALLPAVGYALLVLFDFPDRRYSSCCPPLLLSLSVFHYWLCECGSICDLSPLALWLCFSVSLFVFHFVAVYNSVVRVVTSNTTVWYSGLCVDVNCSFRVDCTWREYSRHKTRTHKTDNSARWMTTRRVSTKTLFRHCAHELKHTLCNNLLVLEPNSQKKDETECANKIMLVE